jgi:hypothetical protein
MGPLVTRHIKCEDVTGPEKKPGQVRFCLESSCPSARNKSTALSSRLEKGVRYLVAFWTLTSTPGDYVLLI